MDGVMAIAVTEAKAAAENETTLEGRVKKAMETTKHHWMLTDEGGQFNAAVAAAMLLGSEEEKARLQMEFSQLQALNAAISGVPVDFGQMEPMEKPVGLMKIWKEID